MSGLGSLFSVMARGTTDAPTPSQPPPNSEGTNLGEEKSAVVCSHCMSDSVRELDILTRMYRCVLCGEIFYV
jgi:hypothetical protein